MKKTIAVVIILVILTCFAVSIDFYMKTAKPYKGYSGTIKINIKKGLSVFAAARLLEKNGIIQNEFYFKIYYRLFGGKKNFKSGEYLFDAPLTAGEVIEKLHRGKVVLYRITIQEGLIIREIAELLQAGHNIPAGDFITAAQNVQLIRDIDDQAKDLEGYLYPDTYLVEKDITAEFLVQLMVKRFKKNFKNSLRWRCRDIGISIRDVVILASIIEKETSSREERFLISSVFHNRLNRDMALASDPTIVYVLKVAGEYTGRLRWKDLRMTSPYNTRIHRGLPPGPICSPGIKSIEAALYPDESPYLYFVAKDARSHYFSRTLKEHNRAVRKYILKK